MPSETEISSMRLVARDVFNEHILDHLKLCPFSRLEIEPRLRRVELNFFTLIGFMAGSGLLGGAAGAAIIKLLN